MGNVLFIHTFYYPTPEEKTRLENIQLQMTKWRMDLYREWEKNRLTPGERYLSKLRFHQGIRDQWKVYKGFKDENFTNLIEFKPNEG